MNCTHIKLNGVRCQAKAIKGSDLCFTHNPEYTEEKKIAVSRGGLNRRHLETYGEPLKLNTPDDIKKLIGDTINLIWIGKMSANQPANSIGFLARVFLDAHEQSELEERLTQLEERLTKAKL
jgi:hypothetical protein